MIHERDADLLFAKTAPLPFARLHADETAATPIASAPPI